MSIQNKYTRRPVRTIIHDGELPERPVRTYQVRGVTLVDLRSDEHLAHDAELARKTAKIQNLVDDRPVLFEDTSRFLNHSASGSPLAIAADGVWG